MKSGLHKFNYGNPAIVVAGSRIFDAVDFFLFLAKPIQRWRIHRMPLSTGSGKRLNWQDYFIISRPRFPQQNIKIKRKMPFPDTVQRLDALSAVWSRSTKHMGNSHCWSNPAACWCRCQNRLPLLQRSDLLFPKWEPRISISSTCLSEIFFYFCSFRKLQVQVALLICYRNMNALVDVLTNAWYLALICCTACLNGNAQS